MGGSFWPLYITTIFNAQKRFLKNSPHDVQTKGGGVKGFLNNVKKNCTFLTGGHPEVFKLIKYQLSTFVKPVLAQDGFGMQKKW